MRRLIVLVALVPALLGTTTALAHGGLGKFETRLTGRGAGTEHGQLDGIWTIDLSSPTSGKLGLTWKGHAMGGGAYTISGSRISLTPKRGGSCTTKGRYTIKLTGDKLSFTKIADTCAVRRDVLTAHPWSRVG